MSIRSLLDLNPASANYNKINPQFIPVVTDDAQAQVHYQSVNFNASINNSTWNVATVGTNFILNFANSIDYNGILSNITINFNLSVVFSDATFNAHPPTSLTMLCFVDNNGSANNYLFTSQTNPVICVLSYVGGAAGNRLYAGSVSYTDVFYYNNLSEMGQNINAIFVNPLYTLEHTVGDVCKIYPFTGTIASADDGSSMGTYICSFHPCNIRNVLPP